MKSGIARFASLALLTSAVGLFPATCEAGLFDWLFPWRQQNLCSYTTYRFAYRPGSLMTAPLTSTTPGCCQTAAMPVGGCGPCSAGYPAQTVQYAPQVSYRTVYDQVPTTTCRAVMTTDPCTGCPVTTYRPFLGFLRRPRVVAYTTYQPVCGTACAPACSPCNPCAVGGCSPCGSAVMPTGAMVDPGATVAPSLPASSCPSCAPAAQVQVQRWPVIEAAPATSAPAETSVLRPETTTAAPYSAPAPGPSATITPPASGASSSYYPPYNAAPAYSAPTGGAALPSSGLPMMPPYKSVPASPSATALPQQPIRPMNGTNWPIPQSEPSSQDRLTARPAAEAGRVQLISASLPAAPAPAAPPQPTYIDNGGWHTAR